jgi:hypothetical protein
MHFFESHPYGYTILKCGSKWECAHEYVYAFAYEYTNYRRPAACRRANGRTGISALMH